MLNKKRLDQTKIKKSKSFLLTLYNILNENQYKEIISWNSEGTNIIISNPEKLSDIVLPKYYLHNKFNSFTRQLNIYGFHKIRNVKKEKVEQEYKHSFLNKNSSKEQINKIKRNNKIVKLILKNNKGDKNRIELKENNSLFYNNRNDLMNSLLIKNQEEQINIKNEIDFLRNKNKILQEELYMIREMLEGHNLILNKKLENLEKMSIKNDKDIKDINC